MALVLLNPLAGGGRAAALAGVLSQQLQAASGPAPARLETPATVRDALEAIARLPRGSRVVVVGGDGTLNRWVPGLLSGQHSLGLVPLGSGNDTARALGLAGLPWPQALSLALQGEASPMDTAELSWTDVHGDSHRTVWVSSLSVGLDAAIGRRAQTGPRWLRGMPRYLLASLQEILRIQENQVQIRLDGADWPSGPLLLASSLNTPTFGAGMQAMPHARIDDGLLHLLQVDAMGRLRALSWLPRLLKGQHLGLPGVGAHAYRQLQIRSRGAGLPLAVDGEWLGLAHSLSVQVQPASLHVVRRAGPA